MGEGINPAADILVIAGGGSGVKQLKLQSYTLSLKADPPSVIFLAFNSFKDKLGLQSPHAARRHMDIPSIL